MRTHNFRANQIKIRRSKVRRDAASPGLMSASNKPCTKFEHSAWDAFTTGRWTSTSQTHTIVHFQPDPDTPFMALRSPVAILPNSGPLEIAEVTIPDPEPLQVVVKLLASGVCHTQLHQLHYRADHPVILGHEATGQVVATGEQVSHVAPGDTVMLTWLRRNGELSRHPDAATLTLDDGTLAKSENIFTWAEYTIADEQFVVKVVPEAAVDVTSIVGCAVMTGAGAVENTGSARKGDSVAVFGAGGVGISAIVAARNVGADPIIAVDIDDEKLTFARRFGATHTINSLQEDPIRSIRTLTRSEDRFDSFGRAVMGADVVIDCIAIPTTLAQAVRSSRTGQFGIRKGGRTVIVGAPVAGAPELNLVDMMRQEKELVGSLGGSCVPDRDFARYVEWYQNGRLDLDRMVTARYRLDQINEAVTALESGEISGRAIIVFDQD